MNSEHTQFSTAAPAACKEVLPHKNLLCKFSGGESFLCSHALFPCNVVQRNMDEVAEDMGFPKSVKRVKKGTDENLFWKIFELAENSIVGIYGPALDWQIGSAGVTGELELSTVETVGDGVEVVAVVVL